VPEKLKSKRIKSPYIWIVQDIDGNEFTREHLTDPLSEVIHYEDMEYLIYHCITGRYPDYKFKITEGMQPVFGIYHCLNRLQIKIQWFAFTPYDLQDGIRPPKMIDIQLCGWHNRKENAKQVYCINLWNHSIEVQT